MYFQNVIPGLFLALAFASLTGCRKSETPQPPSVVAVSPDAVARVHWLGKGQLDLQANAYCLSRVWSFPQTARLQAQTFDRFSTGAWRVLLGEAAAAQIPNAVLRPLLEDLAREEVYLEVRVPTNSQPSQSCFAIHVPSRHAGIWETNLAIAAELLAGSPAVAEPAGQGWTMHRTNAPDRITLTRIGEWTVIGVGPEQNSLLAEITARILRDSAPLPASPTNFWLEADINLPRFAPRISTLNSQLHPEFLRGSTLNQLTFNVTGDGGNVIVHGQLTFSEPLPIQLEPWNIPIALVHEPFVGFTAIRGLQPWLASGKTWSDLPFGAPPDQLYFWALPGAPSQAYFAAPLPDASNQVSRLADYLMENVNPWLATNGYVKFERLPESNGVSWGNMPSIQPFFKFVNTANGGVIFGGLMPDTTPGTNTQDYLYERPSRSRLFDQISAQTNLVYYDWELTGTRIEPCLYLGQVVRVVSRHAQLSLESTSLKWLNAIEPGLGDCTTMITCTGTNQLSFFRKSTVGFTGAELQLLADWLESPQFPQGLHSMLAQPGNEGAR